MSDTGGGPLCPATALAGLVFDYLSPDQARTSDLDEGGVSVRCQRYGAYSALRGGERHVDLPQTLPAEWFQNFPIRHLHSLAGEQEPRLARDPLPAVGAMLKASRLGALSHNTARVAQLWFVC